MIFSGRLDEQIECADKDHEITNVMDNTITRVTISSRFLEQWMIGVSSNLADF
jgi:hypothetical protein